MKEIVLGIDIGGTNTKLAWVDRDGNILASGNADTSAFAIFEDWLKKIHTVSSEMLAQAGKGVKPVAIGVGAPNGNYYNGTIEFAPNLLWKGIIRVSALAKEKFGIPAFLTNDANAAAIGEMLFGGAKGMKDFVVITLGTGVGSGFVVNGKVLYGHDGFAGEVGHIIVDPNGRPCGCGRKGCLETYASARGICQTVAELITQTGIDSSLRSIGPGDYTARDVTVAANNSDIIALEAFDRTAKVLGLALANVVAVTSPQAIFIFGGLAQSGDVLLAPVKKYMEENLLVIFKNKVQILPSKLPGSDAAILGAAALAWMEISQEDQPGTNAF
jgi:glucokinase